MTMFRPGGWRPSPSNLMPAHSRSPVSAVPLTAEDEVGRAVRPIRRQEPAYAAQCGLLGSGTALNSAWCGPAMRWR